MSFNEHSVFCKQGNTHNGKPIVMICLNADCQQRRLCCLVCIDQFHSKHELASLQRFKAMVEGTAEQINADTKSAILNSISQLQSHLFQRIEQVIVQFAYAASQCKRQIEVAICSIKQSVNFKLSNMNGKDILVDLNHKRADQYLCLINEAKAFSFNDIQNSQKAIKSAKQSFEKGLQQCERYNFKSIEQLNRQIKKLKQLTKSKGILANRFFSLCYKSADISINQFLNQAERTVGTGGFPIVLVQEPISQVNNTVNFTIKEQPGNKGVWMGVCVLNIVQNHNFAGCYGIGKGTWAIDQVGAHTQSGFSWNHHDSNYNSKPKLGWKPQTGETVTIKVDFSKSSVNFRCGTNEYEMPIKLDLGDIYFFVGVTHPNDKICIV